MNSSIVMPSTYQLGATSVYTVLQPMNEGLIPFGTTYKSSSSFVVTAFIAPAERTTTKGPTVLKPAPLPDDYDARAKAFRRFLDFLESETSDDTTTEQ